MRTTLRSGARRVGTRITRGASTSGRTSCWTSPTGCPRKRSPTGSTTCVSGGLHIHHLVWGILLLLVVGYVWLLEIGVGSSWVASLTAMAFGVGAALILDEFALWLNMQDVYWERQGRESIDAVVIFAGLLSVGIWGWPFLRALTSLVRRHKPASGGA